MAGVEAPLAMIDGEDWRLFSAFNLIGALESYSGGLDRKLATVDGEMEALFHKDRNRRSSADSVDGLRIGVSQSRLLRCFRGSDYYNGSCASEVRIETQERTLIANELWKQLSARLEAVDTVTWAESHVCRLQENSLRDSLGSSGCHSTDNLDLSDDEELQQCMDLHALILSSEWEVQPMTTADEVINEIEEMMDSEFETERVTTAVDSSSKRAEVMQVKIKQILPSGIAGLDYFKSMLTCDLETLQDDLESMIRYYSEVLVEELALREELTYQKELNNQFISLLLSIQRKRKELAVERRKEKTSSSKQNEPIAAYLTTVVPYDDHLGPPDTDRLQIYIKIMTAIDDDSESVPTLLTNYILKVLCPKT